MARNYYNDIFYPAEDRERPGEAHEKKRETSRLKLYVRYDEGAELYSMCRNSFMKLAAEAGAVHKVGKIALVNTRIFEEYLETFRVPGLITDLPSEIRRGR